MPLLDPPTVTELAYTAGIVDGEGHIQLALRSGVSLVLRVQVTNTKEELIDWLLLKFGGYKYKHPRKLPNHKQAFHWHITENQGAEFLAAIRPYILIKRNQVELALEAWSKRKVVPPGVGGGRFPPTWWRCAGRGWIRCVP